MSRFNSLLLALAAAALSLPAAASAMTGEKEVQRFTSFGGACANCELAGRRLAGAHFIGANFSGASLVGAERMFRVRPASAVTP